MFKRVTRRGFRWSSKAKRGRKEKGNGVDGVKEEIEDRGEWMNFGRESGRDVVDVRIKKRLWEGRWTRGKLLSSRQFRWRERTDDEKGSFGGLEEVL